MVHQVPEWEVAPPASPKSSFFAKPSFISSTPPKEVPATAPSQVPRLTLRERFDRVFPPHRTYFGRSRRAFLIVLLVIFLCLLALVLGLGIGLGRKESS
jgi:hypothetical protein